MSTGGLEQAAWSPCSTVYVDSEGVVCPPLLKKMGLPLRAFCEVARILNMQIA